MTTKMATDGADAPIAPRIGEYVYDLAGKRSQESFLVIAVARRPTVETACVYAVSSTGNIMAGDVILSQEQALWDALRVGTQFFGPGESDTARRFFCEQAKLM